MTTLHLDGRNTTLDVDRDMALLWALRDTTGLTGTMYGCGMVQRAWSCGYRCRHGGPLWHPSAQPRRHSPRSDTRGRRLTLSARATTRRTLT
jgi:hypothetical protein